jgi:hypothetical protein
MREEYYLIKTTYATYYATIFHQYPDVDKVIIGGKKKCMHLSVYKNDDEHPQIDAIGYDENCNADGNHVKGLGSVHMCKIALQFVIYHYNFDKDVKFQLKDTNTIECHKYKLALPIYYMIYHGKTWYEDKFGAVPLFISEKVWKKQKKALREFLKEKPDIDDLFSENQHQLKNYIKSVYNKEGSLSSLFQRFKDDDCSVFKNWLPKLILKFIPTLVGMEWIVHCGGKNDIEMNIKKLEHKPPGMFTGGSALDDGIVFTMDDVFFCNLHTFRV